MTTALRALRPAWASRLNLVEWFRAHDRGLAATRRGARTAIVMPAVFAFSSEVIGNPVVATFAAFGAFSMLLLFGLSGPMSYRLRAQAALAAVGAVFICLGTVVSQVTWLAALTMAVVAFAVLFSGVVSSVLAGATTSLLLAFILPVATPAPLSALPERLAGWGIAAAASLAAVALLWPPPVRDPLSEAASTASRALAAQLRSDVAWVLGGRGAPTYDENRATAEQGAAAVAELRRGFLATPYRPTGLTTSARAIVRLVDELTWLNAIVVQSMAHPDGGPVSRSACAVRAAVATVLEQGADLLDTRRGDPTTLRAGVAHLHAALKVMVREATTSLPVYRSAVTRGRVVPVGGQDSEFLTSLDPSFRAQEMSFAVSQIAANVDLAAAAERRSWPDRLLGRDPRGLPPGLSAAHERATAHVEAHSVWLHNSIRGAIGLALAVTTAHLTGVDHSFWVVLGTLSVLRSNALNTGQNALRGLLGTVVGSVIGGALVVLIGTNTDVLWFLLPVAILIAGIAPAIVSFAAGQAAFTLTLVILYNVVQPAGWHLGLVRVEDIALGCAVSLVVGLFVWPRGAAAAMGKALAEAYHDSAQYLAGAVEFALGGRNTASVDPSMPLGEATRAAAAASRLDDTFRSYLAERGAKPLPLAEMTALVTGVAGLRLAADAVLDLWQRAEGRPQGDRAGARRELLDSVESVSGWYVELASSLEGLRGVPEPLEHDKAADGRLVETVRQDLRDDRGRTSATAVRIIWTGDHLDAVRRLQAGVATAARAAARPVPLMTPKT
ncbi:FUSC family protein [Streptomyces sp. NPDC058280]|uniref:FUSC family protein n=1 Tax=Streptomyces sp. NPDC058280 TaxID=3346419 RepID=UPI0036EF34FA